MPLPLAAIPLAISAIEALLKYRRRIDEILSTKETTVELPYLLPEAPSKVNLTPSCSNRIFISDILQF